VSSPWLIPPGSPEQLARAHDAVVGDGAAAPGVRRLVEESWRRSLNLAVDPDRVLGAVDLDEDALRDYRAGHPLAFALPAIHRLLIRHTFESGLIVAVGDEQGRLLWIDGDRTLRRQAEGMLFVEGADWSEASVGTSAPGTAIALDHGIQIAGPEHFTRIAHPWSCTAVPIHDPESGGVLGVIDITGGDDAVAPATLPLLEAAVAAVEAELRIRRFEEVSAGTARRAPVHEARPAPDPTLTVLGAERGRLTVGARQLELSARHTEIVALLAWHPGGLSAERLAELLDCTVETLRPEMVRLRRVIGTVAPALVPEARPYRLPARVRLDAAQVLAFLDRGAHRVALGAYPGQVLPMSQAPGVRAIREEVSARLREALLTDASADTLLAYARTDEAAYDVEVWSALLRLLPPKSPKRASVVARLERIESELRS
jgi:transcriptional regulator of acetoin/glycerol metabolism